MLSRIGHIIERYHRGSPMVDKILGKHSLNLIAVVGILLIVGCMCPAPPNGNRSRNGVQGTESNGEINGDVNGNANGVGAAAAEPCLVPLENAPEIKGFRLGMTSDQIRKKVPKFKEKADSLGYSETFLINEKATVPVPEGIRVKNADNLMTGLEMADGRLIAITSYLMDRNVIFKPTAGEPQAPEGITLLDYIDRVSETLRLPMKLRKEDASEDYRSLTCQGFKVKAGKLNMRYTDDFLPTTYWFHSIEDMAAKENKAQKRLEAAAEKERNKIERRQRDADTFRP